MRAVAPQWTASRLAARSRAHSHRVVTDHGLDRLGRTLIDRLGRQVLSGPFEGLTLSPMCEQEHLGPFLLGVYESELDSAWDQILRGTYRQVLDVGAKFGYYAVGLARCYPATEVVAFDIDPWAQDALREMVSANDVANVRI